MGTEVVLAIVGVLGTCVGALVWVIKKMFNEILPLLKALTKATTANTEATKHADEYLRERNGRDNAMHKEVLSGMSKIGDQIEAATAHILQGTTPMAVVPLDVVTNFKKKR